MAGDELGVAREIETGLRLDIAIESRGTAVVLRMTLGGRPTGGGTIELEGLVRDALYDLADGSERRVCLTPGA